MRRGQQSSPVPLQKRRKIVKTVSLNHLRAALLAVAAAGLAGLLAAVGLLVVLYAKPAEANYPGKPGKIAYTVWEDRSGKRNQDIYTIRTDGRASSNSLATIERNSSLPTHQTAIG
jgi:hypothetical protein